jgi:hypothetical protein
MGMRVTKKPNFGKYKKRIQKSNEVLFSVAESMIVGIINRTQSGKDKNRKSFKPYSKNTPKSGTVTLTDTGSMLHAINRKKIKNGVKLFFPNTNEAKKAFHNHKTLKRPFFGLDKKQLEQIKIRLGKAIVKTRGR